MKYIKGTFETALADLENSKIRLTMDDGFTETPWIGISSNEEKCVLINHALIFTPFESWGMILEKKSSLNLTEIRAKEEITLHPEAFEQYISNGIIDVNGTPLVDYQERLAAYRG